MTVRLGETETIEHTSDNGLGITVYFGHRKGSANTTDLRPEAIRESVAAACRIARYTSEDPAAGLADADRMAREIPDLDLNHPWDISADVAADIARACEEAARAADPRITNSEGATLYTQCSSFVYGNTHGFVGGYPTSRHSLSCAVIGQQGGIRRVADEVDDHGFPGGPGGGAGGSARDMVSRQITAGALIRRQSDEALTASMAVVQRIRYAAPDRVPAAILAAAAQKGYYVARSPVLMEGRIELLHYCQNQSICDTYHRYGNLGDRSEL